MQHLISNTREEDVEDEAATEDLLQRRAESIDVGSMAEGRVRKQSWDSLFIHICCAIVLLATYYSQAVTYAAFKNC